jgi:hypothetical protein
MSNAYVFRTKIGTISSSHSTNGVVQNKMMFDCLRMDFRNGTKVLFNESMKDLSQVEPSKGNEGNLKIYRGQAAEQQRKKMGLGPPDETDK